MTPKRPLTNHLLQVYFTLKKAEAMQQLPPEIAKAIQYREYRRLRPKHPHV